MFETAAAQRMGLLHTESAFQILAKAQALEAQGRHIIHMEIGQPDFKTPQNIIDAAYHAMNDGYTGYTPTPGLLPARKAIAEYASRHKKITTSPDEVVIVPGGKPVMFYTMLMLVNPGDEVVCPNPSFPIYESCVNFAGGVPVPLRLSAENDFRVDLGAFQKSITPRTKLVIINSPSNPTGGVFTREDVLGIADVLRDRPDIFVLSDEIYDRLIFEGEALSIASLPGFKSRTIILDGFSKTYAMTGWRLGYAILHPELAAHMSMLMVNSNSCAAAFSQVAAIEALTGPQAQAEAMRAAFQERRDVLVGALNNIGGIRCRLPKGAFYAFPDISAFGISSEEFASRLLDEAGVAAAHGTAFGAYGEGHLRLSYATSVGNIRIAAERIEKFTKTL
ncbi:MAG: pyridoxal phosphate-dependent aminotransferase [Oscillospiraceae bacterium]|jgi:aspartate/methionine/tyrosine aminotransferase|nr:pyridoxal phosphate-dependent aminotransferase [Oscillospiraceae bacterium]